MAESKTKVIKSGKNGSENGESDDDLLVLRFVNINGTRMPLKSIHTIKELDEYNYDLNKFDYYILINEQVEGTATVYSNIKIKCITAIQRLVILENIEAEMISNMCEFKIM